MNVQLTRRLAIGGTFLCGAALIRVVGAAQSAIQRDGDATVLGQPCLPAVLYASPPTDAIIKDLRSEIIRERSSQPRYYSNATPFLAKLAMAAARISAAFGLTRGQQPEILLTASGSWRTVDRRFTDNQKEIILLSKDGALPNGSAPSVENMFFAILAHEFGHAYQFVRHFNYGDDGILSSKGLMRPIREIELHADFMAGFGLARSEEKYGKPDDLLRRFSDTIFNLGDYKFAPCLHHGTPAERYTMMMKGYIEAQRNIRTTAETASDIAIELLTRNITYVAPSSDENDQCSF